MRHWGENWVQVEPTQKKEVSAGSGPGVFAGHQRRLASATLESAGGRVGTLGQSGAPDGLQLFVAHRPAGTALKATARGSVRLAGLLPGAQYVYKWQKHVCLCQGLARCPMQWTRGAGSRQRQWPRVRVFCLTSTHRLPALWSACTGMVPAGSQHHHVHTMQHPVRMCMLHAAEFGWSRHWARVSCSQAPGKLWTPVGCECEVAIVRNNVVR